MLGKRPAVSTIMVMFSLSALAGCLQGPADNGDSAPAEAADAADSVQPLWMEDAAGDERGYAIDKITYGPACRLACRPLPAELPDLGDSSPGLDIIRVGMDGQTDDGFSIIMQVASLDASFDWLDTMPGRHRIAEYTVCWNAPLDMAEARCTKLVAAAAEGAPVLLSTFNIFGSDACADIGRGIAADDEIEGVAKPWLECAWDVPVTLTEGTPGTIQFDVPKAYATWDGAALGIEQIRGTTAWFSANPVIPLWHFAWTFRVPGSHTHDHVGLEEEGGVADETEVSAEVRTLSPSAGSTMLGDSGAPLMRPGPGNLVAAGGLRDYPQLDLVQVDMREAGEDIQVAFRMAQLEQMPDFDLQIALLVELDDGRDWEVGVMQSSGVNYGYAGRCISFGCHDAFLVQTDLEVTDDSFQIRFPRQIVGNPGGGAMTTYVLAYTMFGELNQDIGDGGQDGSTNIHSGSIADVHVGGRPFVFAAAVEATDLDHTHHR